MPPAPGASDLQSLLASMSPSLDATTYHFATIPFDSTPGLEDLARQPFEMLFRGSEGWTLIASTQTIDALSLASVFPCKKITLNVHSSLEAVGFLAKVTTRLAEIAVGVNPVSGFYHDHLFVPQGREGEVLASLVKMAEEAKAQQ